MHVAISLLQASCCLAVIKPTSRYVYIACSGLIISSLLQVDSTGLMMQVDCQEFLSTSLIQAVSTTCRKCAIIKLHEV